VPRHRIESGRTLDLTGQLLLGRAENAHQRPRLSQRGGIPVNGTRHPAGPANGKWKSRRFFPFPEEVFRLQKTLQKNLRFSVLGLLLREPLGESGSGVRLIGHLPSPNQSDSITGSFLVTTGRSAGRARYGVSLARRG